MHAALCPVGQTHTVPLQTHPPMMGLPAEGKHCAQRTMHAVPAWGSDAHTVPVAAGTLKHPAPVLDASSPAPGTTVALHACSDDTSRMVKTMLRIDARTVRQCRGFRQAAERPAGE